ncbi:MAG: hypothetical protein ThorAB25_05710 [Candidatus Thorarchaeota archaeon AB_25]|nr:MAG: hypothetical protein ThorAB25_05710 [Candidatus Thorarchaeota archaeon AB_25]
MANDYKRFITPLAFSVVGLVVTFWIIQFLASVVLFFRPAYDLVAAVDGTLNFDINFLLMILIPVFFFEFLILTIPIAFFMLLIAKVFRVTTYNIDVMRIGHGFDWLRIMKRAVIPAFFALSLGELVISLLQGVLFLIPSMGDVETRAIVPILHPLLTLFGSLIALTVSIALFAPTWLLNDAGIVAHVKPKHLQLRRCPDTEGVGRWYSNLIGGFGLLAFPIAMFNRYFYQKFIIHTVPLTLENIMVSLGWSIGLPFMVMAFILPIIMLNEITIRWTGSTMQRIAKGMGASDVQFQHVGKIQALDSQMMADAENLSESMEQSDI